MVKGEPKILQTVQPIADVVSHQTGDDAESGHAPQYQLSTNSQQYLSSWKLAVVTSSLCLGTFLIALDINIIGVAVPKITTVFNSLDDVSWYATAYLLSVTALQPTMGFLYKSFNVRVIYFSSIVIFEAGSILCAAAPSSVAFIIGRAIAGIGAAGLLQGALAIIGLIVELERRPAFIAIVISVFGLAICVGPVMGGAFVDSLSWRWCFWINLPIGAVAVVILAFFLRIHGVPNEYRRMSFKTKIRKMDLLGTISFLGAICCLLLALQWGGQTKPWSSSTVIGLFVGAGLLTVLFAVVQYRRADDALIPLRVLKQRSVLVGCGFLFFVGVLNYLYSLFLPFYFQAAQDVSPVKSGVRIIPFFLPQIVFTALTGILVTRWGHYVPYMVVGMVVCAIGAGFVTQLNVNTPTAQWAAYLVIAGAGLGSANQLPYTAVQVVLSEIDVPTGNALFVFFNQLGGIISIPIAQSLFISSIHQQVPNRLPNINPDTVIAAGAAGLHSIAGPSNSTLLLTLQEIYSSALTRTFILALAGVCFATFCAPLMEWRNIKKEAEARKTKRLAETSCGSSEMVEQIEKPSLGDT